MLVSLIAGSSSSLRLRSLLFADIEEDDDDDDEYNFGSLLLLEEVLDELEFIVLRVDLDVLVVIDACEEFDDSPLFLLRCFRRWTCIVAGRLLQFQLFLDAMPRCLGGF